MPSKGIAQSTADLELRRTRVLLEKDHVTSVSSTDVPGTYPGIDDTFDLKAFKKNFRARIHRRSEREMEFDLIGIDASLANSFRRVLMAEVPTVAVETVYIFDNTSIIADEILAHRLGLIPILADPTQFEFKQGELSTDLNTVVFRLNVECTRKKGAALNEANPDKLYSNHIVTAKDLVWVPNGDQEARFKDNPIRAVDGDIVIAKLRPGQAINLELHCQKGVGKDHAKFSPVCTASYRLLPEIIIKKDITGDLADKFRSCFPDGVIDVVHDTVLGTRKAVVKYPRKDTVSREVLRHPEFEGMVQLTRVKDHFIFSIETTGIMTPEECFIQALRIFMEKLRVVKEALNAMPE